MADGGSLRQTALAVTPATASTCLAAAEESLKRAPAAALAEALHGVNPAVHPLGALLLLDALCEASGADPPPAELLVPAVDALVASGGSEALCSAADKLAAVCRAYKECCIAAGSPKRAIGTLAAAARLAQPTPDHLTPQHADLFQVCLLAKMYNAAGDLLDREVYLVDPSATGVTTRDFLLYSYYGGMLLIGLKQYPRAAEVLLRAVTAPFIVLNGIAIAAYKKFVLVSLIASGTVPSLPKYTSSVIQRHLKGCCVEYGDLATAFGTRSVDAVKKVAAQHAEVFKADVNLGLVHQCADALYKRNIQRLTQTYLTLSLQDIATSVELAGPREAEWYILQMVEAGEIHATIDQRDGKVSFHEDPEEYNTDVTAALLGEEIQKVTELAQKVRAMDEVVQLNRTYLTKCLTAGRPNPIPNAADAADAAMLGGS